MVDGAGGVADVEDDDADDDGVGCGGGEDRDGTDDGGGCGGDDEDEEEWKAEKTGKSFSLMF